MIVTDSFTDTNKALDLHVSDSGHNWTPYLGTGQTFAISSNQLKMNPGTTVSQESSARLEADLGSPDMYAQIKIGTLNAINYKKEFIGVAVRFSPDANTAYYARLGASSQIKQIKAGKTINGIYTELVTINYEYAVGDIIKLTIAGNVLTVLVNGDQKWQENDSSIQSGNYSGISGALQHWDSPIFADDFEAGTEGEPPTGWAKKIISMTSYSAINAIGKENISKVIGV